MKSTIATAIAITIQAVLLMRVPRGGVLARPGLYPRNANGGRKGRRYVRSTAREGEG
jgi:hypothetical protein